MYRFVDDTKVLYSIGQGEKLSEFQENNRIKFLEVNRMNPEAVSKPKINTPII